MRCRNLRSFLISASDSAIVLLLVLGYYANQTCRRHANRDDRLGQLRGNTCPAGGCKCDKPQPRGARLQTIENVLKHTPEGMSKRQLIREGISCLVKIGKEDIQSSSRRGIAKLSSRASREASLGVWALSIS